MAYTPTAYFYIFCRNPKERLQRINDLFDYLNKQPIYEACKEDEHIEGFGNKNQTQFTVKSSNGEDIYTVFEESLIFCCEIDFEADIQNPEIDNYNSGKKLIFDLLENQVIDMARLYSPIDKGRVFHYYGYRVPLILFLTQFNNMKKIDKYRDEYWTLVNDLWGWEDDEQIMEFNSKDSIDFLNKFSSDSLLEFTKKINM